MKRSELFEVLEPPAHGWTRLSARLSEHRQPVWRPALGAVFAVAVVVLGTLTTQEPIKPVDLRPAVMADPAAAAAFGVEVPQDPVAVVGSNAAVMRVPSSNPQVVMYRLATVGGQE